jgi:hypothetical protein
VQKRILFIVLFLMVPLASSCGSDGAGGNDDGGGDGGLCDIGFQDEDLDGTCLPDCSGFECNDGTCVIETGVAGCVCNPGFAGEACDRPDAPNASSVAFWIDAADVDTVSVSGSYVTAWGDKGADALASITSGDDAEKPTLVPNALNGRPVVHFDGDYVQWNDFTGITDKTSYTVFMVVSTLLENVVILNGTGIDNLLEVRSGTGNDSVEFIHEPNAGQSFVSSGFGWSHVDAHIVTLQRTTSRMSIWIDGQHRVDADTSNGAAIDAPLDLLAGKGNGTGLIGDLAEVLIFDSALAFDSRRAVEAYLGAKWFGAAPEVNPTTIAAASYWLDAADDESIEEIGGDGVTSWLNRGIVGGFFTGLGPETRPARVTSALNGQAVVRFDGGDLLLRNETEWLASNSYTLYAVVVPPTTGGAMTVFAALDAGDPGLRLDVLPTDGLASLTHRWPADTTGGDVVSVELGTAGAPLLLRGRRSGPAMSILANDAVQLTSGSEGDIDATSLDFVVGAGAQPTPTTAFTGDIAELVVINSVLANDEADALEEWLRTKWGL